MAVALAVPLVAVAVAAPVAPVAADAAAGAAVAARVLPVATVLVVANVVAAVGPTPLATTSSSIRSPKAPASTPLTSAEPRRDFFFRLLLRRGRMRPLLAVATQPTAPASTDGRRSAATSAAVPSSAPAFLIIPMEPVSSLSGAAVSPPASSAFAMSVLNLLLRRLLEPLSFFLPLV